MDLNDKRRNIKYDRVMSRINNKPRNTPKPKSYVTRHEIPSSVSLGAKPSVSNVNSSVFSELPVVLNDYSPSPEAPVRRTFVVKPRKTLKSLDPARSPHRTVPKVKASETPVRQKDCNIRASGSTPLLNRRIALSDTLRECYSSRSHTRLKDLKDEIKAYHETDKHMRLRSRLYQSCGVVLDDFGQVASDKAVQVQEGDDEPKTKGDDHKIRSERGSREDARAPVPDQQMRSHAPRYPVDRYLVESSKNIEMVNIIDDEIWNTEPALRPEDEIILRKLHDMLQSTADDLKLLSGELARAHEPRARRPAQPAPLDDDFNEQIHIEELVNAKFHGYKIIDKTLPFSSESRPKIANESLSRKPQNTKSINTGVQVNQTSLKKSSINKKLQITRPKIVQIKEDPQRESLLNNGKPRKSTPTVHYNEFSYKYEEPKDESPSKTLQIQKMPEVNIRGELKQQKVLLLDIMPEFRKESEEVINSNYNVGVIAVQHETCPPQQHAPPKISKQYSKTYHVSSKPSIRKVSKMSTYESSESTNNVSSDAHHRQVMHKQLKLALKSSPKSTGRNETKNKRVINKKETEKRPHLNLDEWKKKLNAVYGQPSSSKKGIPSKHKKLSPKKSNILSRTTAKSNLLNNTEYIPYSQLTVGGVRVSDIERELSNIPNRNEVPLSPILDKILSSRENSFHKDSPRKHTHKNSPKVLTTSDENLLQEVIDIEKTVNKTLANNIKDSKDNTPENTTQNNANSENDEGNSYADDFEDDKSDQSARSEDPVSNKSQVASDKSKSDEDKANNSHDETELDNENINPNTSDVNIQNSTYTKVLNLSFKNSVDIFEFVHSIDTHDTGTQSNTISKISLKETQTSPRNEKSNIKPIHNDLWPSIDPKGEVENLFELEKDFIKKLIIEEYGDILEKNINKPSTSKDEGHRQNNVVASQKITQTSPAHVKSVMTSPTRTKTRTTSPFRLSLTVDRQTSPMIQVTNEDDLKIEIANEVEDLGISINLSSPRFSLRLPQTSREILSNLDDDSRNHSKLHQKDVSQGIESRTFRKYEASSSSSVDADNSSSEISSLGEVKLKRKLRKINRVPSVSESSGSSMISRRSLELVSGDILPLKSEGEVSFGQIVRKPRHKRKESDGEMNL
ncbi:uncharacterized protein LOC135077942 [Ostrinia nubilalis]|uniref:uncharacterized protein LOC135077942 n=1 Tax=Ostrinia nubilalis TaxID=29057 RepID=UPI003082479C